MSGSLAGYEFVPSKWEFTHVEFQGIEVKAIGLAMSANESIICLRLSPEDARHVAESILAILGDERDHDGLTRNKEFESLNLDSQKKAQ